MKLPKLWTSSFSTYILQNLTTSQSKLNSLKFSIEEQSNSSLLLSLSLRPRDLNYITSLPLSWPKQWPQNCHHIHVLKSKSASESICWKTKKCILYNIRFTIRPCKKCEKRIRVKVKWDETPFPVIASNSAFTYFRNV